ncbi:MAG: TlpA family protein disulfide reductase [Actinomycetota bacterium]
MKNTGRLVGGAIAAVIAVALVIAVVNGGNGAPDVTFPGGSATTVAPGGSLPGSAEPGEYQTARIQGAPLAPMQDGVTDEAVGVQVPVVDGYSFDGSAVSLDVAASGRPTMLVFLAHWCPHCNNEIPRIIEWAETKGVPGSLRIVGVATSSRSDQPNWPPSQWLVDKGWEWETIADTQNGDIMAAYGGTSFPTIVFVNADGTVSNRVSGELGVVALTGIVKTFMEGGISA